jgi:IS4 transposase
MVLILLSLEHLAVFETGDGSNTMQHQNSVFHSLLKHVPWGRLDALASEHGSDGEARGFTTKAHLIAMLYGQLSGATGLREIEAGLQSHAGQLYHLGGREAPYSTLRDANRTRPPEVFAGLFAALVAQLQRGYRRKIGEAVRLIDATSLRLSGLSQGWASFSEGVCGAKLHVVYDPDAVSPIYASVTPQNVNDITAAKAIPIDPGASYVFDLGYYDFGWWAKLDAAGCRIVTRLKTNTRFSVVEERPVPAGSNVLSDRTGYLPKRMAASRSNPMSKLVREVHVRIDTGKIIRLFTNDLEASAQEIADLYKRRWLIELFFRWIKQTLKIRHFFGTSENAVRIQIAVALIAFVLLRLAHDATPIVKSSLRFTQLIRLNLMHRRPIRTLLVPPDRHKSDERQGGFGFLEPPRPRRRKPAELTYAT